MSQGYANIKGAQDFLEVLLAGPSFDKTALDGLQVKSVEEGRIVCTLKAEPHLLNRYGTMHGGCIATLMDTISTAAIRTVGPYTGMSVNLSVTYMAPVPGGSLVTIESYPVKVGKTLATLHIDVSAGGQLCARGTHIKYLPVAEPGNSSRSKL